MNELTKEHQTVFRGLQLPVVPIQADGEGRPVVQLPPLNHTLNVIMGMPARQCFNIADVFRQTSHPDIGPSQEASQAFVIHFLLNLYLENPDNWQDRLALEVDKRRAEIGERHKEELARRQKELDGVNERLGEGTLGGLVGEGALDVIGYNTTVPTLAEGERWIRTEVNHDEMRVKHYVKTHEGNDVVYSCTKAGNLLQRVEQLTPAKAKDTFV